MGKADYGGKAMTQKNVNPPPHVESKPKGPFTAPPKPYGASLDALKAAFLASEDALQAAFVVSALVRRQQSRIDELEAELRALREQKPVFYRYKFKSPWYEDEDVWMNVHEYNGQPCIESQALYAAPVPPVLRDLSDAELFEAAFDFDCGTNGENKMWLLNHTDHLRWLHDNIIKAAREAV
jgi:hypothetical protein